METIVILIIVIFISVWAYRLEVGMAKANEALRRIEERLAQPGKNKGGK